MRAYQIQQREKGRVTEACRHALGSLRAAKRDLDSAFFWGIIDVAGGMYIVSSIKHIKIESAKRNIKEAMYWLQQFRRKGDQEDYANKNYMRMGAFGTVLDIGLDGIGPDIYAQARIASMRSRVNEAISRMERIMKVNGIPVY